MAKGLPRRITRARLPILSSGSSRHLQDTEVRLIGLYVIKRKERTPFFKMGTTWEPFQSDGKFGMTCGRAREGGMKGMTSSVSASREDTIKAHATADGTYRLIYSSNSQQNINN